MATATVFWPDCFETIKRDRRLTVQSRLGANLLGAVLDVTEVLYLDLIIRRVSRRRRY